MAHTFTHSPVVIRQLAQAAARTPPSEEDSPSLYVDRSLTILAHTSDIHSQRIREEFLSQREFIARQMKEVENKLDERFETVRKRFKDVESKMDERFKTVGKRFDDVGKRFDDVGKRFDDVENKMDERFKNMEKRLGDADKKMDEKIYGVDKRMRDRLSLIQNASRNILRIRGWEAISPVGSLDPSGGLDIPRYFPRTIRHFWRLKDSQHRDRLIYLIRFYKIQGYEEWGRDTDSFEEYSDSDDSSAESSQSSRLPIPLEGAVRSYPEIAHRALGTQLGLAYDEIQRFMERAKEYSQAPVIRTKRRQGDRGEHRSEDRDRRVFQMSPTGTEVTSPTEPRSSQVRTG